MQQSNIHLSLCMIARDSSRSIGPALRSIRPWVDEMIVVDTGSHDDTPRIARDCGAHVEHFPWCDDFARARNESLRHARGSWLFWMDSDDTMDPHDGRKLAALSRQTADRTVMGYVMQVHCPAHGEQDPSDVTIVDHVKMIRNSPEIRFEFRIHEQVLPSIRRAGGAVAWTDIHVTHSGSDQSPEGRRRKQQRDLRLLELEAGERPDHPFLLFNLGMTWADAGDHQRAADFLHRCLQVSHHDESHLRKAYALLATSYSESGEFSQSEQICAEGLSKFPDDPELLFRSGLLAQQRGRFKVAIDAYRAILATRSGRYFSSRDRGILGFKARHNLGVALASLGRLGDAEMHWREVIDEAPRFRVGWQALSDSLLDQQKFAAAEVLAAQLSRIGFQTDSLAVNAEVCHRRGKDAKAMQLAAAMLNDDSLPLCSGWALNRVAKLLFDLGEWRLAEQALEALVNIEPANEAAARNLKTARSLEVLKTP